MNNRWKAVPRRLGPCSTVAVAVLAVACGSGIDEPQDRDDDGSDVVAEIDRDDCEDNILLAGCQPEEETPAPPDEVDTGFEDAGMDGEW